MQIYRLPALFDNYIFLLHDINRQVAAVVDPAEIEPVLQKLHELKAELVAIFNTHHHSDHVGGNTGLLQHFPKAIVYGGTEDQGRIPGQKVFLKDGDRLSFADREIEIFFVPGHTKAHIAYYFPPQTPEEPGELFCGDTLFAGGCGRLFEGSPDQMIASLEKLRRLPDHTRVWCAHEYTFKNLQFAINVDRHNDILASRFAQVRDLYQQNQPTVPSWLGVEKQTNPFLRWDQPALQAYAKSQDPVAIFAYIRQAKDRF